MDDELARVRRLARARSGPRILRREVAASGLHLADEPPAVGQHDGHPRARTEAGGHDLEPVAGRGRALQQQQPPADRVDRDVEPAVVVVVRDGETTADDAGQSDADDLAASANCPAPDRFSSTWIGCASRSQVRDGNGTVGEHQVGVAVEVEVGPGRSPTGERAGRRRPRTGPPVGERRAVLPRRQARQDRVLLPARVADEEIGEPVAVDVCVRDPHARIRVRGAGARRHAPRSGSRVRPDRPWHRRARRRSRRAGSGPRRSRHRVEATVAVEIGEDRAERVVEPRRLEPRRRPTSRKRTCRPLPRPSLR